MSTIKRKVSFYRLSIKRIKEKKGIIATTTFEFLSCSEIEKVFREIMDNSMHKLNNSHYAVEVNANSNKYVVEVISFENNMVFAKIGLQNDATTVALRDQDTLESENVPMSESQLLEVYTYFLIDFTTGILAYIGINGAPRISAIQSLFNKYYCLDNNSECVIASIMTKDTLKILNKKHSISKVLITVAVPSGYALNEFVGVPRSEYMDLRDIKTSTIQYTVVARRNGNIFSSSSSLSEFMADLKTKHGDKLIKASVNAKGDGLTQTYDLLQYNFTQTVFLTEGDSNQLSEIDFRDALMKTYYTNKDELLVFIRS